MILVTGGLGFIGSHTASALLDLGREVVVTSHRSGAVPSFLVGRPGFVVHPLDVVDPESWAALDGRGIQGIVHLASTPVGSDAVAQVAATGAGVAQAIAAARRWGVERLLVASTIGVYGGSTAASPYREDAELPIAGPFGIPASKKVAELLVDVAAHAGGPSVAALRLPAVWGPLGNPASPFFALPALVHGAARGETAATVELPRPLYEDDAIDTLGVRDVAARIAAVQLAGDLAYSVYNVGSGRATSNRAMLDAVVAVRPKFGAATDPFLPGRSSGDAALDITRLEDAIGMRPVQAMDDGVRDYLDWLDGGNPR